MDQSSHTDAASSKPNNKYWAFISYSSKDAKWGRWLHGRLEGYPIPKEFQGTQLYDGGVLGRDLKPCFRDRDELSGSSDLGPAIRNALSRSRYLIVLCSRNSAKSEWVNKEIEDFMGMGGERRILALILDGQPNAILNPNLPDSEECFPPALRYPVEPLAGDMRKEGDGKERGFLKVLSGIVQLDFDLLYRRHERAQRKKRLVVAIAAASIMLLLSGISVYALLQRNLAIAEALRAEKARATAEASEMREREAKEKSVSLLKTIRSSLFFMNFDLEDVLEKYVPIRERSAVIDRADELLESLQLIPEETSPNGVPDADDLRLRMVANGNKGDLILRSSANDPREALAPYTEALLIAEKLVEQLPDNSLFQSDLAHFHSKMGDLCVRTGKSAAALGHYEENMRICEKLIALAPGDRGFMTDLSNAHEALGDLRVFFGVGNSADALGHYEESLKLRTKLVGLEPDNTGYQRNLSNAHERLGHLALKTGQTTAGFGHFEEGMRIKRRLVEMNPDHKLFQCDLAVFHETMGKIRRKYGEGATALAHFEECVRIREKLARFDPNDAGYQSDLAIAHHRLGELLVAMGEVTEALGHYEQGTRLQEKLAGLDPDNANYKLEFAMLHASMGDLRLRLGENAVAIGHFKESMGLIEELVAIDPDNARFQRNLSVIKNKLGDQNLRSGETAAALRLYEESMQATERLVALDPDKVEYQRDLGVCHGNLGRLRLHLGDMAAAVGHYEKCRDLAEKRANLDPNNAELQRDVSVTHYQLSTVYAHEKVAQYGKVKSELEAALAILERQKSKGTLSPDDEKEILFLKSKIKEVAPLVRD